MLAAFLYAQFEARDAIQEKRQQIWERYNSELSSWADQYDVQLPTIPAHCEQSYHMFYMVLPSLATRQNLIAHLRSQNILSVFHYLPLHLSEMGMHYGGKAGDCPVTERLGDCLLRLPFYNELTDSDQARVISAIQSFDSWA